MYDRQLMYEVLRKFLASPEAQMTASQLISFCFLAVSLSTVALYTEYNTTLRSLGIPITEEPGITRRAFARFRRELRAELWAHFLATVVAPTVSWCREA